MKCPICQSELIVLAEPGLKARADSYYKHPVKCSIYQDDKYNNTHYYKYRLGNSIYHFDETEQITIFPFMIKNLSNYNCVSQEQYHKQASWMNIPTSIDCGIYKFSHDKNAFKLILDLPHHIHADTEDKLRDRINRILLLS